MSKLGVGLTHDAHGDVRMRKRPTHNPVRRLAAAVAALALGAGLALVGVAAPASAHHNTITAEAVCSTDGTTADITWTVANSEDLQETITKSSDESIVATGTTIPASGEVTFVQQGAALGETHELKLSAKWSNNQKANNAGAITLDSALCGDGGGEGEMKVCPSYLPNGTDKIDTTGDPKTVTVTAPDGKLIDYYCVKAGSVKNGNGPQIIDVEPPAKTVTITYPGGKAISHYSVHYVDEPGQPQIVTIEAAPSHIDLCGIGNDTFQLPSDTQAIDWSFIGSVASGEVTVSAAAKLGYIFAEGAKTSWTFTFTDEPCEEEPEVVTIDVVPTSADLCGTANDGYTLPSDTDAIAWSESGSVAEGEVVVTATAKDGYRFADDATTSWTFAFTDEPCEEEPEVGVIEVVPTMVDLCGTANDGYTVPSDTDDYSWSTTGSVAEGKVVVTATPAEGYVFEEGSQSEWTFVFTNEPCAEQPEVVTIEIGPRSVDACGTANDGHYLPEDTDAITWNVTSVEPGVVTVTATANPGYVFAEGVQTSWTFTYTDEPCRATLEGSVATGVCEANAPWIFFTVQLDDPDGTVQNRAVQLVLSDGTNTETLELGELDEDGTLEGRTLWPGASVDDEGNADGWPGWEQLEDGTWAETDGNFAWTRDLTSATLVVNPELSVALSYPPATPDCVAAPPVPETPGEPGGEGEAPSTPTASGGSDLAETGFAGTSIAIVAGVIVLAGAAFVVVARLRRKKA
ncbi:hypothetical protein PX701_14490 [Agromyces sp. H3Y2-19a]|uniref:InlB B-repeat-containing protein n=1 Tax=Agromyces chromiiresistens TaxID=3030835 RepID=UPI0023B97206|nr:hypothetical protein [Agromyces chromiiresistens]MDF0514837.1 hypothetical protein [Agromyces chromiiresistens]